jgi:hypothetical protein
MLISQWITYQCSILDGILNIEFAKTLSKGTGKVHGIDSSEAMINAAKKAAEPILQLRKPAHLKAWRFPQVIIHN